MDEIILDLKVEILRKSDNKLVSYIEKDRSYNRFWWEEGNASCDCNRHLFFERVLGVKEDDIEDFPCNSEDNAYIIRLSNNNTMKKLMNLLERKKKQN